MARKNMQKSQSRSAKSTGSKDQKKSSKRRPKAGIYFTIAGEPRFFVLNVDKKGKIDQTELKPEVIVDCVMHVLGQAIESYVKAHQEKEEAAKEVTKPKEAAITEAAKIE